MCLRFEGIPTENNKTSDKDLEKIMGICKDSEVEIPDTVIDRTHRIDIPYVDKTTKNHVRASKKNMKSPVRVKIDLTKKRHNLLVSANKYVSNIYSVKFCYADINCRLRIIWEDESINDTFFYSLAELKSHVKADE